MNPTKYIFPMWPRDKFINITFHSRKKFIVKSKQDEESKDKNRELLHNRGAIHVKKVFKFFSGNDPSRGKNMRGIRIWHFQREKILPWSKEGLCIEAKSHDNRIFTTLHRPSLDQGSVFSLRKCQIRIPRIFLPLEGSFPEKNFENFFMWCETNYRKVKGKSRTRSKAE